MWFLSGDDGDWGGQAPSSERLHAQVQQGQSQHHRPEPPEWWRPQWSHWSRYTGHHWPTGGPHQAQAGVWRQERWVTHCLHSYLLLFEDMYTLITGSPFKINVFNFHLIADFIPSASGIYCLDLKQLSSFWSYNHSLWLTWRLCASKSENSR